MARHIQERKSWPEDLHLYNFLSPPLRSERTVEAWTGAAAGLGVRKTDFRKVKVATVRGNAERWAAFGHTLGKVWPALRGTASRKRSRRVA